MLYLVFEIGGQKYAMDTAKVVEVLPLVEWRRIPGIPDPVRGVFNYHGRMVPVLDMSVLAESHEASMRKDTRIALMEYEDARLLGILLENATRLMRKNDDDFVAAPVQSDAAYAGRVTMDEGGMVQLVELRELVSDDVWVALDGAAAERAS